MFYISSCKHTNIYNENYLHRTTLLHCCGKYTLAQMSFRFGRNKKKKFRCVDCNSRDP